MRFYLPSGENSREGMAILRYPWRAGPPELYVPGACPVGDVDFVEQCLCVKPKPDFYPEFLHEWLHRELLAWPSWNKPTFCKSEKSYKCCPSLITPPRSLNPMGPNGYSTMEDAVFTEVVQFVQEWRYYVTDGHVVATGWYDGEDEDEPAPDLPIDWPDGFCGAVDFGRLITGNIALVESHHPYACGWYGESSDNDIYAQWLWDGYLYLKRTEGE